MDRHKGKRKMLQQHRSSSKIKKVHDSKVPPLRTQQQPVADSPKINSASKIVNVVSPLQENTILVSVGGKRTRGLVDTGAQISIASLEFLKKTCIDVSSLKPADIHDVVGVGNEHHKVLGTLHIPISISGVKISYKFYILEQLRHAVILGMDFLEHHKVQIDLDRKTVYIQDKLVSACYVRSKEGLARTDKGVTIPAGSEVNIQLRVSRRKTGEIVLLEPLPSLYSRNLAGAKCLVQVRRGRAPIRLLNPTDTDIHIPGHRVVATVNDIDIDSIHSLDNVTSEKCQPCSSANVSSASPNSAQSQCANDKEIHFNVSSANISESERSELLNFLERNKDVFSTSLKDLGRTDLFQHSIETDPNAPPVHLPFYRQSPNIRAETHRMVDEMLEDGIIEPSSSVWNSPVVMIKKRDNTYRFAVDYRKLNKITQSISHPLPRLECVFDTIGQAKARIFSTLDLASGFWQIPMDPSTRHKAAFITHNGVYEWTRMPFGLKNAPMTFQMVMSQVLRELNWKHVLCYIDDILVFSSNFQEHLGHLDMVFSKLREAGLTLKSEKCHFAVDKVLYLGHIITNEGVQVDTSKTDAVRTFPRPKTQRDVRSFLGLCNYYRRFIQNFSKIATPLNQLLQKDIQFNWTDNCETAFNDLKQALITAPMLRYPDMNSAFILSTDASGTAIGYILGQKGPDGKEMVVAYGGRSLRPEERKYTVSEQECLAVVEGIKAYKEYLSHQKFTVYTDHQALKWLHSVKDTSTRLGRWAIQLQEYQYDVVHKQGRVHLNADALSRRTYDTSVIEVTEDNSVNSVTLEPKLDSKQYIKVEFTYKSEPTISVADKDAEDLDEVPEEPINKFPGKTVSDLPKECVDFRDIFKYLENGTLPDDKKLANKVMLESNQYALLHGVLYHFYQPRVKNMQTPQRLVRQLALPGPCREDVLLSFHDSHAGGGHLGVQKTFAAIRERYYFPGMYQIIHDYVTTCDLCQRMKVKRKRQPPPLTPMPIADVFSRWHMDILGPLPKAKGYQYVLLLVNSFSRWCEAFPLETHDAKTVASVLYNEIICRYGAPRILVSDRGQNFMSKLVSALCEMFDITRHHTSSYHPQTNSTCERLNSTLAQTLRMYCEKDQSNWPDLLPSVMMSFRVSPATESISLSPFHMVFGREMTLPVDTALVPKNTMTPDARQYFEELLQRLKLAKDIAVSNMRSAQEKSKQYFDQKAKEPNFAVHDRVLLGVCQVPTGLSPKLFQHFEGPYYIVEVGPNFTYKLRRCSDQKLLKSPVNATRIVHYKDPYIMRDIPDNDPNPDPIQADEAQGVAGEIPNNPNPDLFNDDVQPHARPAQSSKSTQSGHQKSSTEHKQAANDKSNSQPLKQSEDIYFEVEKLLKMRYVGRQKQYLVKWKGDYPNSWEPENNITDRPKREYHIQRAKRGRKRRRRKSQFHRN